MPTAPDDNDTALLKMILNRKIDMYVKRDGILNENLQKAYSLIHGQCTELLKRKLKTSANWETVSSQYDMLGLLEDINTRIYKFEDQNIFLYLCIMPRVTSMPSCKGTYLTLTTSTDL